MAKQFFSDFQSTYSNISLRQLPALELRTYVRAEMHEKYREHVDVWHISRKQHGQTFDESILVDLDAEIFIEHLTPTEDNLRYFLQIEYCQALKKIHYGGLNLRLQSFAGQALL